MIHSILASCLCTVALAGGTREVAEHLRADAHIWQSLPADVKALSPPVLSLAFDGADGRLDDHTLWRGALIACGIYEPSELAAFEHRLDEAARELSQQLDRLPLSANEPIRRGQIAFEFLHRRILTGKYRASCTDLREVFATGDFNCVSATLLYNSLATRIGIEAQAIETPYHAFTRVSVPGRAFDVQTTCPRWYEFLDRPEEQAKLLRLAAQANPGMAHMDRRRELNEAALLAIVAYNRGIDHLEQRAFPEAFAANWLAVRLDADCNGAAENLLTTLNNWSLELGRNRRFTEAIELLELARRLAPEREMYRTNLVAMYQRQLTRLVDAEQYDELAATLDKLRASWPAELFSRLQPPLPAPARVLPAGFPRPL